MDELMDLIAASKAQTKALETLLDVDKILPSLIFPRKLNRRLHTKVHLKTQKKNSKRNQT